MKKQKIKQSNRNALKQQQNERTFTARRRPLHVHIALHPVSILLLLCIGVLLVIYTFRAFAVSTTVTAVVSAPALAEPAVITSPADSARFTDQALTVTGTCPDGSYVQLFDNNILAGAVTCGANTFSIGLDLTPGSNELRAQDYNITNDAGPASSSVVVTYTPQNTSSPSPTTPPTAVPNKLLVTRVDGSASSTSPLVVSAKPTFAGVAPPASTVAVTIRSNPNNCQTSANGQGYWSCTLSGTLRPATYTAHITATTLQGVVLVVVPDFEIKVVAAQGAQAPQPQTPFRITTTYAYQTYLTNQPVSYTLHLSGGSKPYAFAIDWGDNKVQTILRQTPDDFTINHTYGWINTENATRTLKIQAVDADGQASTLQLQVVLRNPAFHVVVPGNTHDANRINKILGSISPRLWLIWPGYTIVVLMVLSFWLGERQEIASLLADKKKKVKSLHHAHVRH